MGKLLINHKKRNMKNEMPEIIYAINNFEHQRKWYALNLNGSDKYIRFDKLEPIREALEGLVTAVGNMRVPQNMQEAATQVAFTLGPQYKSAKKALEILNSLK